MSETPTVADVHRRVFVLYLMVVFLFTVGMLLLDDRLTRIEQHIGLSSEERGHP